MNDYNVEVTDDRGKIATLIGVIIVVVILLVLLITITFLDIKKENAKSPKLSTTTRRNFSVNDIQSDDDEEDELTEEETTSAEVNEVEKTTNSTTTTITQEKKKTTTAKRTVSSTSWSKTEVRTSTKVIEYEVEVNPFEGDPRTEVTFGTSSGYPDSKSDWEWEIVDLINKDRRDNGLSELKMVKELRALAEEGADLMLGSKPDVVKSYLYGHNNYRFQSNYTIESPANLYDRSKNAVDVATNNSLKYLGVGVIYKQVGNLGSPTYYYVLIWE